MPDGQTWYIKTNRIATIIDFGRSHIELRGEHFGVSGFEQFGTFNDRGRPWYDIYKLLGFCLYDMLISKNYTCLNAALPLLQLIDDTNFKMTKKELYDNINTEADNYFIFSVQETDGELNTSLADYLAAIKNQYPSEWNRTVNLRVPKTNVLDCERFCPTASQFESELTGGLDGAMTIVNSGGNSIENDIARNNMSGLADIHRKELNELTKSINTELNELSERSSNKIGNALGYDDINFTLREYVEPYMDLKEQIASYMDQLEVLRDYEQTYGNNPNLVEFELGSEFEEWRRNYKQIHDRIANALFPVEQKYMKAEILDMMYL